MPIYEYECRKCKQRFEHLLKSVRDAPAACPHCGGKKIEKVFSGFSVAIGRETAKMTSCASCPSAGGCPHRQNNH